MNRVNRDTVVAAVLVAFASAAFLATFSINTRDDGIMQATVWPRVILALMIVFSITYLIRSLRETNEASAVSGERRLITWLRYYRNPLGCFALYFSFLATLPYLGILIGGVLLVFLLLSLLGGFERQSLLPHAMIAALSIGGMWAIFTFALKVILPAGELLPLVYRM
jgi:putative tricarboxylic transport membrane protein